MVLLKNVLDAAIAGIFWRVCFLSLALSVSVTMTCRLRWLFGYAFAFGSDKWAEDKRNGFIGLSGFAYDINSNLAGGEYSKTHGRAFWLFQWAFASVSATIVSGAIAGRVKFYAYCIYSVIMSGFVYPIVVHVAWSDDGWFSPYRQEKLFLNCGVVDIAGSAVVHLTGGMAALAATIVIGPREGRFSPRQTVVEPRDNPPDGDDSAEMTSPGSPPRRTVVPPRPTTGKEKYAPPEWGIALQSLGTLILWVSWYAFNGVSTIYLVGRSGVAAVAMMNTTIAAGTSCLVSTALGYLFRDHDVGVFDFDPTYSNNGILSGLVAITSGCAVVNNWGAFFIGLVAGCLYCFTSRTLKYCRIDDVVDAIPVHAACGMWGVIATSLFATECVVCRVSQESRLVVPQVLLRASLLRRRQRPCQQVQRSLLRRFRIQCPSCARAGHLGVRLGLCHDRDRLHVA